MTATRVEFPATIGDIAEIVEIDESKLTKEQLRKIEVRQKEGKAPLTGTPKHVVERRITGLFTVGKGVVIETSKEYSHSGYTVSSLKNKTVPHTEDFPYSIGDHVVGYVDDLEKNTDIIKRECKKLGVEYEGKLSGKVNGYGLFGAEKFLYIKPDKIRALIRVRIKCPE